MLADCPPISIQSGTLNADIHPPATFYHELISFVADKLPLWRDDPERPSHIAETILTEHLCDYLTSAARKSYLDFIQFRTEVDDKRRKGRKIDLTAKPCGAVIWIDGRCYTKYDSLLPIECKRLPTPNGTKRDEREYVISRYSTTGGIQRFKSGHHGGSHTLGLMIAYIQKETRSFWINRVSEWITGLVESGQPGWNINDLLHLISDDKMLQMAILNSSHVRENGLTDIELHHLWISIN